MTKLTLQKPNAEILGTRILPLLQYADTIDASHYNIDEIHPDQWYPQCLVLDILQDIQNAPNATQTLVRIGMSLVDRTTLHSTLMDTLLHLAHAESQLSLNTLYTYIVEQIEPRCIQVIDFTVWPHDLIYGMFWQIAAKHSDEADYTVVRNFVVDDRTGHEIGVYHFRW